MLNSRCISSTAALADRKEELFRGLAGRMTPAPGLPALLDLGYANGVRMAVVTNAPRANAELMLGAAEESEEVAGGVGHLRRLV